VLSLIFENANYANVGDATGLRGSSTAGVFYVSLHTGAGPTDTGAQNSSEATYSPYARVSVARSTAGWSVASGVADNDAAITFAACSSGSDTVTQFGIGSDSSSTGNLFLWGALTSSLAVSAGITPAFAIGALDVTLD
jgi:hypothetical protein